MTIPALDRDRDLTNTSICYTAWLLGINGHVPANENAEFSVPTEKHCIVTYSSIVTTCKWKLFVKAHSQSHIVPRLSVVMWRLSSYRPVPNENTTMLWMKHRADSKCDNGVVTAGFSVQGEAPQSRLLN